MTETQTRTPRPPSRGAGRFSDEFWNLGQEAIAANGAFHGDHRNLQTVVEAAVQAQIDDYLSRGKTRKPPVPVYEVQTWRKTRGWTVIVPQLGLEGFEAASRAAVEAEAVAVIATKLDLRPSEFAVDIKQVPAKEGVK